MSESVDLSGPPEAIEEALELRESAASHRWLRFDYVFPALLLVFLAVYAVGMFFLGLDIESLKRWGYLGIFLIAMSGSATIVLPTPSNVAIFSGGVLLDPVMGIPAPLLVGLVAGLGDAIGEFSGYILGYAGTDILKNQRMYERFEGWMRQRGTLTVFLLCTFPNPLFDLAGAAAGATRMPPGRFFVACLGGKIVKDLFLAYGGSFSFGVARNVF